MHTGVKEHEKELVACYQYRFASRQYWHGGRCLCRGVFDSSRGPFLYLGLDRCVFLRRSLVGSTLPVSLQYAESSGIRRVACRESTKGSCLHFAVFLLVGHDMAGIFYRRFFLRNNGGSCRSRCASQHSGGSTRHPFSIFEGAPKGPRVPRGRAGQVRVDRCA